MQLFYIVIFKSFMQKPQEMSFIGYFSFYFQLKFSPIMVLGERLEC